MILIIQDIVNSLKVPKSYAISIHWLILLERNEFFKQIILLKVEVQEV